MFRKQGGDETMSYRFTLTYQDDYNGGRKVTLESNASSLGELVHDCEEFIRGCGFFPPEKSSLDWVYWGDEDDHEDRDCEPDSDLIEDAAKDIGDDKAKSSSGGRL
jgi:hypothetical protein